MKQQISFQQYRSIDLGLLGIFMAVSQLLIQFAVSKWFPGQLYVVSPVATVVALVMMRWGPWAAIHAVVGGVLFAVLAGGGMDHILIYGAGNLLSLAALLMFKVYDKERVRQSALLTILFALCAAHCWPWPWAILPTFVSALSRRTACLTCLPYWSFG